MNRKWFYLAIFLGLIFLAPWDAWAVHIPNINIGIENTDDPKKISAAIEIILILTVLSLAPSILLMMTSFTRLIIVFGFLRQAIGTQQMPPNQVLIGLSLFLTLFIMQPVWTVANQQGIQPYLNDEINFKQALKNVERPLRKFMFKNTREADLALFAHFAKIDNPKDESDIPMSVLIPSFMISELKTAFEIGFILYIPFLIIDMVVSSVLLSMGMMMLPPVLISLPFKLLLFVLVDGWHILAGSLLQSFS
ncbi:MAG: flagellar type III secretion system pore protein FliP [Thermodesulfobacteria bacterium]|nr:flagellar type III secretion system pore protein FliP [Thermodesulfobacteriota bacterium]